MIYQYYVIKIIIFSSHGELTHRTHAYCPLYDYVPPDLVTLFITNS